MSTTGNRVNTGNKVNMVNVLDQDESSAYAARLMLETGADSLVVIHKDKPVGIITDHDLALRVAGGDLDPSTTPVRNVMSQPLIFIEGTTNFAEVLRRMRKHGIRRMPVLENGQLVGLVEQDDLLITLAAELSDVAECVRREIRMDLGEKSMDGPRYQEKKGLMGWRPHLRWQT